MSEKKENNPVIHPNHYNWIPGIEAMDVVQWFPFCIGNVLKYIWRAPYKSWNGDNHGALEDLLKAQYYLDIEIKKLESGYGISGGGWYDGELK